MVPTIALGIHGSGTAAVLLEYLTIYGLNPGPRFFETQSELAWTVIGALAMSAIFGLVLNIPLAPLFSSVLNVPSHYLYAFILLIAMVSGYGLHGSVFDAVMVVVFGLIGFLMRLVGLSSALLVIGVVLGSMLEETFRQAYLLAQGDLGEMLLKPVPLLFFGIAIAGLVFDVYAGRKMRAEMSVFSQEVADTGDFLDEDIQTDARHSTRQAASAISESDLSPLDKQGR